jgi:hypothetical protein
LSSPGVFVVVVDIVEEVVCEVGVEYVHEEGVEEVGVVKDLVVGDCVEAVVDVCILEGLGLS